MLEPSKLPARGKDNATHVFDEFQKKKIKVLEDICFEVERYVPNVRVEKVVASGPPHKAILQLANEWPADLIVLGSHGRTDIDRYILGSVSLSVVSNSPCSIALVKVPDNSLLDLSLCDDDMPQQVCTFDFEAAACK